MPSPEDFNFAPSFNATIAVTSSSQRIPISGHGFSFLFQNVGTVECFVEFGDVTATAVAGGAATASPDGSLSVPAGVVATYSSPGPPGYVAAVTASGATLLRVSQGNGS